MLFVEKFSNVDKTNACQPVNTSHTKMTWLPVVTFMSISVHIGGGSGPIIQVVVFDTFINACVPIIENSSLHRGRVRYILPFLIFACTN